MSKLFVKYNDNWADEMDITGFVIITKADWNEIREEVRGFLDKKMGWEYGVGTNEQIEYSSFEDWSRAFTVTELTDAEAATLIDVFKRVKIRPGYDETRFLIEEGFFAIPREDEYEELEDEEDDEEEDDDEEETDDDSVPW